MSFYGGGTVQGALRLQGRSSPGLSAAGEGRIYFDSGTNEFLVSENGGAYVALSGATETLADTLAAGNVTGGSDIVVSNGDAIVGETEINLQAGTNGVNGSDIDLLAGNATSGLGGSVTLTSGGGGTTGHGGDVQLTTGAGGSTSGNSGAISLQVGSVTSGALGSINIGTANDAWIYIGDTLNANQQVRVQAGDSILVDSDNAVNIGTADADSVTIGRLTMGSLSISAVDVSIQSGGAETINIGTASAQTINIGAAGGTVNIIGGGTQIEMNYQPASYPAGMWVMHPAGEAIYLGAGTIMVEADGVNNVLRGKYAVAANNPGENLTCSGGYGNGTGAGGALALEGGAGGATGNGGAVNLTSGAGGATSGNSGNVTVDAGAVTSGTAGTISVGVTNASALTIGRSGVTTTVNGTLSTASFAATGSVVLGAVTSVSTNTTLGVSNAIVLVDASGGAVTITLPTAASANGRHYTIKKIDSSANAVTIDGDGAETIDGATTQSLAVQYDALQVVSNGTAWFVV